MPELLSMVMQKGAQRHNSIPVTLDVLSVLHLQSGACWSLQALKLGRLPADVVQPHGLNVVQNMVCKRLRAGARACSLSWR